jgi:hypothetical protein
MAVTANREATTGSKRNQINSVIVKMTKFMQEYSNTIIVVVNILNVHAPSEEKSEDLKDSFCEELEQVFLSFSEVPYENLIRRF